MPARLSVAPPAPARPDARDPADPATATVTRRPVIAFLMLLAIAAAPGAVADEESKPPLPLPAPAIPEPPPLPPTVITPGGQKLLLEHTEAELRFDHDAGGLVASHPGWWLINFPLDRIGGLEDLDHDEVAQRLFGRPAAEVRNWYVRTPGQSDEPAPPDDPARVTPHPSPTLVVDREHPAADDGNDGAADSPLATISAAVERARPGDVIQVRPGGYRETVEPATDGTADQPIILQGVRDADGRWPTISANDPAPAGGWQPVAGHPGVWRADGWTGGPASVAIDGRLLRERTVIGELGEFEFCQNYAAAELAAPTLGPELMQPGDDDTHELPDGWDVRPVTDEGFLELGDERGGFYLSTWIWLEPGDGQEEWDPRFPQPLTGDVRVPGGFRAGRLSSANYRGQLNLYRLWLNGELMPAAGAAGEPRANTDYGVDGDHWQRLPFREGWNHVFVLADSAAHEGRAPRLRWDLPAGRGQAVSRALPPPDPAAAGDGEPADHVREWAVLGPLQTDPQKIDRAVYLRLPEGVDPDDLAIDMGARQKAGEFTRAHWHVSGLEFVHGRQWQQASLVSVGAPGVRFEHNLLREPEVRTLTLEINRYAHDDPMMVVRGNWMISPGSLAIGGSGDTGQLTPDNLDSPPARGRVLLEHNTLLDNNRSGYARFWESGAIKIFRFTGSVLRHNTIIEGDGPAIWLDWEHYNNRIEGNLILRPMAFGIGIEASPGPHLIANNVVVDTRPGGAWFEYALLAWSSARVWAVANSIDGPQGIMFAEGQDDRNTRWGALDERPAAVVNNLVVGRPHSLHRGRLGWVEGNRLYGPAESGLRPWSRWPDEATGEQVESSDQMGGDEPPEFTGRDRGDLRLPAGHADREAGVPRFEVEASGGMIDLPSLVVHDHFGLLRFPEDGFPVGAWRNEPPPADAADHSAQIEIEWADGTLERRWRAAERSQ